MAGVAEAAAEALLDRSRPGVRLRFVGASTSASFVRLLRHGLLPPWAVAFFLSSSLVSDTGTRRRWGRSDYLDVMISGATESRRPRFSAPVCLDRNDRAPCLTTRL